MKIKELIEKLKSFNEEKEIFGQQRNTDGKGDWFKDYETNEVYEDSEGIYITLTEL